MTKEEFIEYVYKETRIRLTDDQFSGKEKIEGHLYLNVLTSIPKGFNPVVGGNLNLRSLTSIPEGFNPVVGYNLWLDSLTEIPENFNPEVKGKIFIDEETGYDKNPILEFINFHI